MTHRERASLALDGGRPDFVPHFEIEFQETSRDFDGREFFTSGSVQDRTGLTAEQMNLRNARIRMDIANKFAHSIIVSTFTPHCPGRTHGEETCEQLAMLRELAGGEFMLRSDAFNLAGAPRLLNARTLKPAKPALAMREILSILAAGAKTLKPASGNGGGFYIWCAVRKW